MNNIFDKNGREVKIGMRVLHKQDMSTDTGIVTSTDFHEDKIWVKWDSDQEEKWVSVHSDTWEVIPQPEMTLQIAIDFIISQGYTVTLNKICLQYLLLLPSPSFMA